MCGIVGWVDFGRGADPETVRDQARALAHRGPDDEGFRILQNGAVALGHRRLAIIDLSPAGRQPIANEDETVWLTFNGELYNFRDLRRELVAAGHRFRSQTDSEVVVHAYEQWGRRSLERFRGIFAFALWNDRDRSLWLARDHLGVKPLYYHFERGRFSFASELKGLLTGGSIRPRLDGRAVADYLSYGYVPFDRAIFEGMHKLPAGHHLIFSEGAVRVEPYWDVRYTGEVTDEEEALRLLRTALTDAVETQLVSDVPVGVLLSGGIDSSAVTALAADRLPGLLSFTMGFDRESHDERPFARALAQAVGSEHRERLLTYEAARELITTHVDVYDEPFFDSSGLPTYLLCGFAREHVKVALAGDGGDEVFAGYRRYDRFIGARTMSQAGALSRRAIRLLWRAGRLMGRRDPPSRMGRALWARARGPVEAYLLQFPFLDWPERSTVLGADVVASAPDDPCWLFRRFWRDDYPAITGLQYLDMKTYLVDDILTKVDRASMAHGLEVRVPLLDHRLVETVFRISAGLVYANGERKSLFKRALRGLVPDALLTSRKKGFSVPLPDWFAAGLREDATATILDGSLVARGVLRPDHLRGFLERASPYNVWLLFVLELWARRWLDHDRTASATIRARAPAGP